MKAYLVNQGRTFDEERKMGYIRAIKYNSKGTTDHHHELLKELESGDIIFHCAKGEIKAISTVQDSFEDFIWHRDNKEMPAWRVRCKYNILKRPLYLADYKDLILKYRDSHHSPFNKNGNNQQGYLFKLNDSLYNLFYNEIKKMNNI